MIIATKPTFFVGAHLATGDTALSPKTIEDSILRGGKSSKYRAITTHFSYSKA